MPECHSGLVELGEALRANGYQFVAVTPSTHERVLKRDARAGRTLRDVFGWNRPCSSVALPPELLALAQRADVLESTGDMLRSRVRFATLGEHIFVHSSYPTSSADAVFFGPDSYRFCSLIARSLGPCKRVVDVGCGTGVGGLIASSQAEQVVLTDVNQEALDLAQVNARLAGVSVQLQKSDVLAAVEGPIDAVIANPPYMRDEAGRAYRDGGGKLGEGLAVRIAREALARLQPGGRLVLYTGAAVVDGEDVFRRQVVPLCNEADAPFEYLEIDPDVFGEELQQPAYANVERIAAVGLVVTLPAR